MWAFRCMLLPHDHLVTTGLSTLFWNKWQLFALSLVVAVGVSVWSILERSNVLNQLNWQCVTDISEGIFIFFFNHINYDCCLLILPTSAETCVQRVQVLIVVGFTFLQTYKVENQGGIMSLLLQVGLAAQWVLASWGWGWWIAWALARPPSLSGETKWLSCGSTGTWLSTPSPDSLWSYQ